MKMLVSFIIPAYNAADTIVRCLDSVYRLSLKRDEFEVIVIDDASTDNTIDVIEQYRSKMGDVSMYDVCNLTLIRQPENHRQGAARNRGVSVAKGEYICFVDADDAVTEGIVKAVRMTKEKKADMAAFHFSNIDEHGKITSEAQKLSFDEGTAFSGIEMQNTHPYWCSAPWGYIYSKEFLKRVAYPFVEDVLYEDSDFVAVHLYYATRMAYSQELGYKAFYREGSTTHHNSYNNIADYFLLGVRMMKFYECIKVERMRGLEDERIEQFAEGILEGACWNVQKSCKRIIKLGSIDAVRAYYDRIETKVKRKEICADLRFRKYYWNAWTSLCVGHKKMTIMMLAVLMPMYKIVKRCKLKS